MDDVHHPVPQNIFPQAGMTIRSLPGRLLSLAAFLALALPVTAGAHGAMQKIVEGRYLMNLTSVPIAPVVGQKQSNLFALSDAATNTFITADSVFFITVKKNGKTLYTSPLMTATGGLLAFDYAYPEPGTYELQAMFRFPDDDHQYMPDDYWVQVNETPAPAASPVDTAIIALLIGIVLGACGAFFLWRARREV